MNTIEEDFVKSFKELLVRHNSKLLVEIIDNEATWVISGKGIEISMENIAKAIVHIEKNINDK